MFKTVRGCEGMGGRVECGMVSEKIGGERGVDGLGWCVCDVGDIEIWFRVKWVGLLRVGDGMFAVDCLLGLAAATCCIRYVWSCCRYVLCLGV